MMIVRPMIVRPMMVVRLSGHPLIRDSLTPLATALSLKTGCGILPDGDDTEELSMKAPMSVSKPADLG